MELKVDLKEIVRQKYGQIAEQSKTSSETSCCGTSGCCGDNLDYTIFSESYSHLDGYNPDADMGLGCGIPTQFANIKSGDTVVDLGSGAGNDCFVASQIVGETGLVIGVDMTKAMIDKAKANSDKLGCKNVKFRLGEIENLPITANKADVIISNCVINLVPDKYMAFAEMSRVLKYGGHFCISDVVLKGKLPETLQKNAEMYAGCVAGAIQEEEYLKIISDLGFVNIEVKKRKKIEIPENLLEKLLSKSELEIYKQNEVGIFSITVYAEKPVSLCSCNS